MKRFFGSASIIFFVCVLVIAMTALTGCGGDKEDSEIDNTPSQLVGEPVSATQTAPSFGQSSTGTTPSATPATVSDDKMAGAVPKVPFSQAPVKSGITYVTDNQNGVKVKFLRFKYADTGGNIKICEIPEAETKINRTAWNWINTFDVYKIPVVEKNKKKTTPTRLADFPFVSPAPSDNSAQSMDAQPSIGGSGGFSGPPTSTAPVSGDAFGARTGTMGRPVF